MQTDNRILDDLARVAGGAFGTLNDVRVEIENLFKQRLERVLSDLDVVPREEFDAVKAMAEKARMGQEALEKRVAELESALAATGTKRPTGSKKSAGSKESAGKKKSTGGNPAASKRPAGPAAKSK